MKPRFSSGKFTDLQPGDHLCWFYETEEEHRAVLTPFLRRGLELNEKVMYLADSRDTEVILSYLSDDGVEVKPYLASGQLTIYSTAETYMRQGGFDPSAMIALLHQETAKALAEGYSALRATGEMTWAARGLPGSERLLEYEGRLNEFFSGSRCLAICQYDRRRFDPASLLDILAVHPIALIGMEVMENFYYLPAGKCPEDAAQELAKYLDNLTARQRGANELQKLTHDLGLKNKELRCLYDISKFVEKPGLSLWEILQGVVDLMPLSWQYPEITCARITLERLECQTVNFQETPWKQASEIIAHGECAGAVQVCYLEERPAGDEGPFLEEERSLLDAIAGRLGRITERLRAEAALKQAHAKMERRVEERTTELRRAYEHLLQEIEGRQQIEDRLRESEARFAAFMRHLPGGAVMRDAHGHYLFANDTWRKMFWKEEEEEEEQRWLAKPLEEVWPADLAQRFKDLDRQVLASKQPMETEETIEQGDGPHFWLINRFPILDDDNHAVMVGAMGIDITKRLQAEAALRSSEAKYRTLVEQIPAVTYIAALDEESTTLYMSPQIEAILGFSLTEYEVDPDIWRKQLHPEDRERVLAEVTRSHSTGEPFACEYRMLSKGGEVVWFRDEAWLVRDAQDHPLFLQGVILDITKGKELEEALRKSEEKYRCLVNQIPAVVFQGHADWSIDCFDRKIEILTGYAKEDFDSRRLRWCDLIPEEDMDYVKKTFVEALKTEKSYVREHRIRKKNGEYAWVQCRGQIFCDAEGKVEYVSGVTFDITKRKRAEEALRESEKRYRLLAENVSDVIFTANMDLKITYISPSIRLLQGFSPEEVRAQSLEEMMTPASLELAWKTFAERMAQEMREPMDLTRSWTRELELLCKDGSTVWTEVRASFLRDCEGCPVEILGVARDISERKRAELALRRRDAILEALSFAAENFLKAASWKEDIQEILGRLGQAIEVSRVYIFENHRRADGALLTSQRHEWVAPGVTAQIDNPELQGLSWRDTGFARWEENLAQDRMIFGHVREFPLSEQESLAAQDIKSIVAVPIFLGREWWGIIGFDECVAEREWSLLEMEALRAVGDTLGTAIQHERAEKALRESEQELRHLTSQLLSAQELERKRISQGLHDEMGQALAVLKIYLNSIYKKLRKDQGRLKQDCEYADNYIDEVIENVRRICRDLAPYYLEELGLTASLRYLFEELCQKYRLSCKMDMEEVDELFSPEAQVNIFRIFQESLTNIGKHAEATQVTVDIKRQSDKVLGIIADNGKGFNVDEIQARPFVKKGLGLAAMAERARMLGGSLHIWSQAGQGTRITFVIPSERDRWQ